MANSRMQISALLRKNGRYQLKGWISNCCLLGAPIVICVLLILIQAVVNNSIDTPDNRCGCKCLNCCDVRDLCTTDAAGIRTCTEERQCRTDDCAPGTYDDCTRYDDSQCGLEFSTFEQAGFCAIENPSVWPPLQTIPSEGHRAAVPAGATVQSNPPAPPVPQLFTGGAASALQALTSLFYSSTSVSALLSALTAVNFDTSELSIDVAAAIPNTTRLGTTQEDAATTLHVDPAWLGGSVFVLSSTCSNASAELPSGLLQTDIKCAPMAIAEEPNTDAINDLLYCGWEDARCDGEKVSRGYAPPVDFMDTSMDRLAFTYWENYTTGRGGPGGLRRGNAVAAIVFESFINWKTEGQMSARLEGLSDFPSVARKLSLDFSSLIGPLFYTWVLQILLPIIVLLVVYEKEKNLIAMMRMHGLSDRTYWLVMYGWYFVLHVLFIALLLIIGSAVQLKFFRLNSYSLQIVFYLIFINMQVGLGFFVSTLFTNARAAVVCCFLYVFGSGLVAGILIDTFYARNKWFNTLLYLYPPFGLYRAMWEFGEYAFRAGYTDSDAMTWSNLDDHDNDLWQIMIIFALQGPLFLLMAWYFNHVLPGNGIRQHWLFCFRRGPRSHSQAEAPVQLTSGKDGQLAIEMGRVNGGLSEQRPSSFRYDATQDVEQERLRALEPSALQHPIVLRELRKIYPARDGQPPKMAVDTVSLVVKKGECFGLLGQNGAGKSTTIQMMVGQEEITHGSAYIAGRDVAAGSAAYEAMGVCPQDDLIWETLTAREHLNFYGRLKDLKGAELSKAVDDALEAVQLTAAKNKRVGKFSGGMKRRLSVAIAFIGKPQVVYLDEPSTGLDPASRHSLWSAIGAAKQHSAIILTTHSMQEAETLCDRLAIMAHGRLIAIGNPKDLTSRFGNYLEFSLTVKPDQVAEARRLVESFAPGATQTYAVSGTMRYDLPAQSVELHSVFEAMHRASSERGLDVLDWGIANATLEEVFIKLARQAREASAQDASYVNPGKDDPDRDDPPKAD